MITLKGNRHVRWTVEILSIENNLIKVHTVCRAEGEILHERFATVAVGDFVECAYSLDMDNEPLTKVDLLALMKGQSNG